MNRKQLIICLCVLGLCLLALPVNQAFAGGNELTYCASALQIPVDTDRDGINDSWQDGSHIRYRFTLSGFKSLSNLSGAAFALVTTWPDSPNGNELNTGTRSGNIHSVIQLNPGQVWRTVNNLVSYSTTDGDAGQFLQYDGQLKIGYITAEVILIEAGHFSQQNSFSILEFKRSNC